MNLFPTAKRADAALDDYRDVLKRLTGAVQISLDNAKSRSDRAGHWMNGCLFRRRNTGC